MHFPVQKQIITHLLVTHHFKGDLMKHPVSLICSALWLCGLSSYSFAADVPSGTTLAPKQELVRHIKDEPASLDPAKAVGLPEIQVIRDLFEGLVNQNEKGELVPGVPPAGKVTITVPGPLPCVRMPNGLTAPPSPHRILSTAGSVWSIRKPRRRLPGLRRWPGSAMPRPLSTARPRRISSA